MKYITIACLWLAVLAPCSASMNFMSTTSRVGAKYTTPQEASLSLGSVCTAFGSAFLIEAEPGVNGGKLNFGYGLALRKTENFIFLKASVLRTWDDPIDDVEPDTTYLGAELEFMGLEALVISAGVHTRIGGDSDSPETIFSGGIGIAFWKF